MNQAPKPKRIEKYFDNSIVETVDGILNKIVNNARYTRSDNTNFIIPRGETGQKKKGILLECLRLDSQSMTQWRTHQHGISSEAIRHVFDVIVCFFGEVVTGEKPNPTRFSPIEVHEKMYHDVVVWLRKNMKDDVIEAHKIVSDYFLARSPKLISEKSTELEFSDSAEVQILDGDDAENTGICHIGRVNKLDASLPNGHFVSCGDDGHVKFLEVKNLRAEPRLNLRSQIYSVQVSSNGSFAACGTTDRNLTIIKLKSIESELITVTHPAKVADIAISPDSKKVATACDDGCVRVWNEESDWTNCIKFFGHKSFVRSVNFSACGLMMVSCSADETAIVWDTTDPSKHQQFKGHEGWIYEGIFIPNTEFIATCGTDNTIRVWSSKSKKDPTILRGHTDWVTSLDVSPDGARLLSASRDGTARIWDWRDTGPRAEKVRIGAYNERLRCARYTRDGLRIVTASTEGRIAVWTTPT